MALYTAYGLTIESDMALPGVEPGSGEPDVQIRNRPLPDDVVNAREQGDQWIWGTYRGDMGRVLVADGKEVSIDLYANELEAAIVGTVLGELMATLLRQRGLLVFHASAVADAEGRVVAVAGESGWGKSTLAEYMCQNGYTLLSDDTLVVDFDADGVPFAIPSYGQIRLVKDAAAHLVSDESLLLPLDRAGHKLAREDHALADRPLPLRALFLLENQFRDELAAVEIPAQEALMRLIVHTRANSLVETNTPGLIRDHLDRCARLLRSVPVKMLHRRRALDELPAIQSLIEEAMAPDTPVQG